MKELELECHEPIDPSTIVEEVLLVPVMVPLVAVPVS